MAAECAMKAAVLTFPGSNCDRDLELGFARAGFSVSRLWHKETALPEGTDVVGIPGGFSYGDYLRCGAIAARSPVMAAVRRHAERGGFVLGVCNGFQILTEAGLLPGALMCNAGLRFICRPVPLTVETVDSAFTALYRPGQRIVLPIAHRDGNYQLAPDDLRRLEGEGRIALRYAEDVNGSAARIAGVLGANRRILGLMPHPERASEAALGGTDGQALFAGLAAMAVAA